MNQRLFNLKRYQPLKELSDLTRRVAGEGIVLLENKNNVLPIKNEEVAIFGRIQTNYYNSGTGSGGLVNVKYIPSFLDAFLSSPLIKVNEKLKNIYLKWVKANPFDEGNGQWASEPWSQVEMEVEHYLIKEISSEVDTAIILIGRTAGEDRDHFDGPGSYRLTAIERDLIFKVSSQFKKTVVVLNCGNTIDTSWINEFDIDSLVYAFAGGEMGAHALVDVLTGLVNPSGRLTNTIARSIKDYPSNEQFRLEGEVYYEEDIYVGYRYFETFAKRNVLYPFGYGLSYTNFEIIVNSFCKKEENINIKLSVKNVGLVSGKEVVQIYLEAPNGLLGKAKRVLVGFAKTKELQADESETITFNLNINNFASYDDIGSVSLNAYVLESGIYNVCIGRNVRSVDNILSFELKDTIIVEQLKETIRPRKPFRRLVNRDGLIAFENVPLKTQSTKELIKDSVAINNNNQYNLIEVYQNKISSKEFVESLEVEELAEIVRGEGMSSPKVTPGTAAAFGGVTKNLVDKGIPIMCAADGPSGIRMDSGLYATSLPAGVTIASTFNLSLIEQLYELTALELRSYEIDLLLAPGTNINRHPLNGRNFEYFSEDPLLSGMMATAVLSGLAKYGISGSLKHLAANNQETDRFNVDAIVSERALREIYLKTFEIPVKAGADVIMTSYNPINGIWAASNYEINQMIVRDEWGFKGIIITDWWAKMNDESSEASRSDTKSMIKSSNDLYMVVVDAKSNSNNDNTIASFNNNELSLYHLQNAALNIVNFSLTTPAFYKSINEEYISNKNINNNWFITSKENNQEVVTLDIEINGKKVDILKDIYQYEIFEDKISNVVTSEQYYLSEDLKNLVVKVTTKDNNYYYYFNVLEKKKTNSLSLATNPLLVVSDVAWKDNFINLKNFVYKSDSLKINRNGITTNGKTQSIVYAIEIKENAKYVFEFDLEVKTSDLAQVPFSILLNNEHKSTLTLRNTNGEVIKAKSYLIIERGIHHLTFKFNRSGIIIKKINVLRHG